MSLCFHPRRERLLVARALRQFAQALWIDIVDAHQYSVQILAKRGVVWTARVVFHPLLHDLQVSQHQVVPPEHADLLFDGLGDLSARGLRSGQYKRALEYLSRYGIR